MKTHRQRTTADGKVLQTGESHRLYTNRDQEDKWEKTQDGEAQVSVITVSKGRENLDLE